MPTSPSLTLAAHFASLEDPRVERTKLHPLLSIVVIAICAVISGAESWDDIAEFGEIKADWFSSFLDLPHGIPSHDTFNRVFAALDPVQFRSCFLHWMPGKPKPSGNFTVSAYMSPNPVSYGSYPTLYAKSTPGASCTGDVVYSTGRRPVSFDGSAKTVGSSGVVSWSWHMESKGSGGTATVSCSLRGRTKRATTGFSIG